MVESKYYLIMKCDKCGGVLKDDHGHIVKIENDGDEIFDHYKPYNDIYQTAEDKGWLCGDKCLCPACVEKVYPKEND